MTSVFHVIILSYFVLVVSGCASIVGEKQQSVTVNSNPPRAKIMIVDEKGKELFAGETPTTVTLEKGCGYFCGHDYTVTFKKDGYKEQTATIKTRANGWYVAGNLVFGGLIGWLVVDPATGSMWTLSPEEVTPSLERVSAEAGTLNVVLLEDVPADKIVSLRPVR